jgi:hypothetical protein
MSETYCHLCDADPCYAGQSGHPTYIQRKMGAWRSQGTGRRHSGVCAVLARGRSARELAGWLRRIEDKFGEDAPRPVWNRVSNDLDRAWLLISHPAHDGPMMHSSDYPEVRRLPLREAIAAVERLIDSGGWVAGEKGLRLWQVVQRIGDALYISIYDALHDMNGRDHRVTTTSPRGKPSQFWYVK